MRPPPPPSSPSPLLSESQYWTTYAHHGKINVRTTHAPLLQGWAPSGPRVRFIYNLTWKSKGKAVLGDRLAHALQVPASPRLCGAEPGQRYQPSRHLLGSPWPLSSEGWFQRGLPWAPLSNRCRETSRSCPAAQSAHKGHIPTGWLGRCTLGFLTRVVCAVCVCERTDCPSPESPRALSYTRTHVEEHVSKLITAFPSHRVFVSMLVHVTSIFVPICDRRADLKKNAQTTGIL